MFSVTERLIENVKVVLTMRARTTLATLSRLQGKYRELSSFRTWGSVSGCSVGWRFCSSDASKTTIIDFD